MNDDRVFQLLMDTNPVPDPDALDSPIALAELKRGSSTMATTERLSTEGAPPRRTSLIAAAAAAVVLVIGIGSWALINRTVDTAGADIDLVMASYEALNEGDIEAYLATLGPAVASDVTRDNLLDVLANLDQRTELVEPCRRVESAKADVTRIQCTVTVTNDFEGPADVFVTSTEFFEVDEQWGITNIESVDIGITDRLEYDTAFWSWLLTTHPDVYAEIEPSDHQSLPGYDDNSNVLYVGDANDALIAVQYVAEFVEQSDKYPLETP